MARRVFFSFHYENDVWRSNVVRNSWVTKTNSETAGFIDAAEFEQIKKGGDTAIKNWINNQLLGTSVTVVLIGSETNTRPYILYELQKSWERGNGIFGIYIHQIRGKHGETSQKGSDAFGPIFKRQSDNKSYFFERFKIYDWVDQSGYSNLGYWVEQAARDSNK